MTSFVLNRVIVADDVEQLRILDFPLIRREVLKFIDKNPLWKKVGVIEEFSEDGKLEGFEIYQPK